MADAGQEPLVFDFRGYLYGMAGLVGLFALVIGLIWSIGHPSWWGVLLGVSMPVLAAISLLHWHRDLAVVVVLAPGGLKFSC